MDSEYTIRVIQTMKQHLGACTQYLDALEKGYLTPGKVNTLMDAAMQQVELCCIDMRNLCEKARPIIPPANFSLDVKKHKEIYGEITLTNNGWVDIRLNSLLPHCKVVGGTQYVTDTITRLVDKYAAKSGRLPCFEKAYMAIVEHCPQNCAGAFDSDNKGFKGVINALKGRLFKDDDQFELALGLFSVLDDESCCHIYVTPFEEAGDFHYQLASELL